VRCFQLRLLYAWFITQFLFAVIRQKRQSNGACYENSDVSDVECIA
jgi:hypothetical protein